MCGKAYLLVPAALALMPADVTARTAPASESVCQTFAASHPAHVNPDDTVLTGDFDVTGNGQIEHVSPGDPVGTMRRSSFDIVDRKGVRHNIEMPLYEAGGGIAGRWFVKDRRGYLVSFVSEDEKYIAGIFAVTKKYEPSLLCTFNNEVKRTLLPLRPEDKSICDASDADRPPDLNIPESLPPTSGWRFQKDSMFGPSTELIFDNAGTVIRITPVVVDSSAGRGCTYDYFELANDDGSPGARHQRELLEALQERGAYSNNSPECPRNRVSWFTFGGKTFLRSRPGAARVSEHVDRADRVNGVVDGVPRRICQAYYSVTWTLADQAPLQ